MILLSISFELSSFLQIKQNYQANTGHIKYSDYFNVFIIKNSSYYPGSLKIHFI